MSLSRAQSARLGIFLLSGLVLLAILIAIPLGVKLTDKFKRYTAYFSGESLSGLEQGSTVKFNGVPVGKVESIKYLPDDLSRVKVELKLQEDFPMKVDMIATTNAMGITGLKYIEITGGTNDAALLKEGSVVPTKPSMISAITGKAEVIMAKIEVLLNHLNEISNPDSLVALKSTLANVQAISVDIKDFVNQAKPHMTKLASSSTGIIAKVDSIAGDVRGITKSFADSMPMNKFVNIINQVDSTTNALKELSENLALMIRQTREDFTVSMQNIREASENANNLTKTVAENPSLLLRGENLRERTIR
ncbi:MAG: MlaD family protein [Fibrobacterota bacterium]|nr:MlaD family protein [Chitinispirillaceae bacterium]